MATSRLVWQTRDLRNLVAAIYATRTAVPSQEPEGTAPSPGGSEAPPRPSWQYIQGCRLAAVSFMLAFAIPPEQINYPVRPDAPAGPWGDRCWHQRELAEILAAIDFPFPVPSGTTSRGAQEFNRGFADVMTALRTALGLQDGAASSLEAGSTFRETAGVLRRAW